MNKSLLLFSSCCFLLVGQLSLAQHLNKLKVTIDATTNEIHVKQQLTYHNDSEHGLSSIYFNDWNHAYSNKKTALATRFADEFNRSLYFAKDEERGRTTINSVVDENYTGLKWERLAQRDIVKIHLDKPLPPHESTQLFITYTLKLPNSRFTDYGYYPDGSFYLKDWYLSPAVFDGEWRLYSDKDLGDLYTDPAETTIDLIYPKGLNLVSNFDSSSNSIFPGGQQIVLKGSNRKNCEIVLTRERTFTNHITLYLTLITDIEAEKYTEIDQGISINKIAEFLHENLGDYPHTNLLVSNIQYNDNPLYGLNQLPSFIRPYGEKFQFEMKVLKTALESYLSETLFFDKRKDRWVNDAIANYLMIKFVEKYYPNQKLIGKLANIWGVRSFHLADMGFNEQYAFFSMLAARKNIDQALSTPNDSLIRFNQKIANRYKAGLGLAYLAEYVGEERIDSTILDFFNVHKLSPNIKVADFKNVLEQCSDNELDWFFEEYVKTRKKIDYKIKKISKTDDSITFVLKNKRGTNVPISLFGLKKDSVVSKYWFKDIDTSKTFTIPRNGEDRLVLNYDQKIPEFNQRDNWKTLNGFFSSNKPLKFQFFKDTEDPYYNQVFYVPVANFNIYDGVTPGLRIYNKTFLERPFQFDIAPTYSFLEKTLVGKASLRYRQYHGKSGLYLSSYQLSGSTSHFQVNSRFTTLTPSVLFGWRPDDLISNRRQFLLARHRSVFRNIDGAIADEIDTDPDYSVFNVRFQDIDNHIINYKSWWLDAQHSADFTKLAFELEYRWLYENNRQFNIRLFAGKFLRNKTDSDFFSFALDRPTDYLFDLDYLGRSEDSGIYSQQIIIAEGGFKSQLPDPFANDWMATANASVNIWRWIELYGDIGYLKNKGENARFVYDSGVRLNLVTDYFELYFPLHSNNGWEIAQPNYNERIRFLVTISPRTLIGLFTRKWF
ncbi:metalloprotease [Allomuricauda sp. SCSIO 65647]|uniref:metalloprotease n=1 Tax=Allomuricauda sp. SCSIO 65647 TaxID=2908843 RepID=UPI001F3DBB65|nr:metalloprotease [Muricauda sp. SCSIO 65647]UJH67450.1 metalloprotease [Muricauda sp. SCSIO 65647]